ncbi:MAG: GNAT family N-acetyltransferase [Aerococcaceae bacterium]|nr:GNAT family N-acetyltransferase [Aerococcaceae bacterium]
MSITIRPATLQDVLAIQSIYAPYVTDTAISLELEVPTAAEMETRLTTTLKAGFPYLVAINEEEQVIGFAYAGKFHERKAYDYCCTISIYLAQNAQAKGIGQQLYQQLEQELYQLGFIQIVSLITSENQKSIAFHLKNNFTQMGYFANAGYKFNQWYDLVWYVKTINPEKIKTLAT